MNLVRFLSISSFVLILLTGCKTTGKLADRIKPDINKKTNQLLEKVEENAFTPDLVSFKASGKMDDGEKSNSFKLNIRMKRDSVIWISVTAYSYEAARILATPDSLFFINRPEKKYFRGDYDFINEQLNVDIDFKSLQSILLANSMGLDEMDKVKRSGDKDFYILGSFRKAKLKKMKEKSEKFDGDLVFSNWVDPETYRIAQLGILDLRYNKSATVKYSDFSKEGPYNVAHKMEVNVSSAQPVKISAEYYRFTINETLNFPFKISDKYEPLD